MGKSTYLFHKKLRGVRITKLMSRDGLNCTICKECLDRHVKDCRADNYITFDHIVPRSLGGGNTLDNLRLAHQVCNRRRGNDPIPVEEENNIAA